ncbi:MAG: hypothetical protein LUQ69_09840, partial [Methanoregulaceae archaeon]|nr:hypothetical protein [Methanoregulaceae archaeon]
WDTYYDYHFSSTIGGAAVPGYEAFSGTVSTPEKAEDKIAWWLVGICSCLALLVLLILVIILIVVLARGKKSKEFEE